MSVLADFYVSSNDAEAVRYDTEPTEFLNREQFTSLTNLELSTLWSLMRSVEWDENLLDQFPCILQIDNGQRTIHRLPAEMVARLGRLNPEEIFAAATKWARTDELACEPGDVQPIIEGLVRLGRKASGTGQNIYLWNCV